MDEKERKKIGRRMSSWSALIFLVLPWPAGRARWCFSDFLLHILHVFVLEEKKKIVTEAWCGSEVYIHSFSSTVVGDIEQHYFYFKFFSSLQHPSRAVRGAKKHEILFLFVRRKTTQRKKMVDFQKTEHLPTRRTNTHKWTHTKREEDSYHSYAI